MLTNAKTAQMLEQKAFENLNVSECIKRFIKTMLVEHPEETVCNTITNNSDFQLMKIFIDKCEEYNQPLKRIENASGRESSFFIDYEYHQGEL
jgi:hypothetical protein